MYRRLVPSVLVALSCVLLIGAAAPAAGALTRDAQMRQNLRLLQVYIERYAAGQSFVYPAASIVRKGGGLASPVWPTNPWTSKPMAAGTSRGDYTYAVDSTHVAYSLTGWLPEGRFKLTGRVPSWLQEERGTASAEISMLEDQLDDARSDLAAAQQAAADAQAALAPTRKQAAELGARLIRSYVEQWGMLNNATAPSADKVSKTGAIGLSFTYWPDDPYTGSPMTPGGQQGGYLYSPGSGGAYSMSANTGAAMPVTLDGTVPQQLTNALTAARDEYVKVSMYYLQGAIDRSAIANNLLFPAAVDKTTLSPWAFDYWPSNPWFAGMDMSPGMGRGSYTYSTGGPNGYALSGHLSDGTDYTVDGFWAEWLGGFRDNLKDMCVQAHGQVLREYIEEWKATHGGTPPTADEMAKAGAVGASHGWWPLSPWTNAPMVNRDTAGDFQYTPGAGVAYALTVRQRVTDYVTQEYYTPE